MCLPKTFRLQVLTLHLVCEHLKGTSSHWHPYLQTLQWKTAKRQTATRWSDEVLRFSPSLMEVVKGWQELLESQLDIAESRFNETIHACGNNAHGIKYTSRSGWQVSDTKADAQK